MEMIVLYGYAAVGKLAVADELAAISDFKVFHNHLSFDLIHSFIEKKDDFFWKCVRKLRLDCVKFAKKKNINLLLTTVYLGKESDDYIRGLIMLAKKENIKIRFVHLFCSEEDILERVCCDSRQKHGKLQCPVELKTCLDKNGISFEIPYVDSLEIDNSKKSAKVVARLIKKRLL